jgi:hypothetical protein
LLFYLLFWNDLFKPWLNIVEPRLTGVCVCARTIEFNIQSEERPVVGFIVELFMLIWCFK